MHVTEGAAQLQSVFSMPHLAAHHIEEVWKRGEVSQHLNKWPIWQVKQLHATDLQVGTA